MSLGEGPVAAEEANPIAKVIEMISNLQQQVGTCLNKGVWIPSMADIQHAA